MKTSDLIGPALDWAVAKCEGEDAHLIKGQLETRWTENGWRPSTDWSQGGPIIERERIQLKHRSYDTNPWWVALIDVPETSVMKSGCIGPTPLVAAMRAFAASKLGDTVEVPEELI